MDDYYNTLYTAYTVVVSIFSVIGIPGNLLVLVAVIFIPKMRSPVNICLASLALTDLFAIVGYIFGTAFDGQDPSITWSIYFDFTYHGCHTCSVFTFMLIGVERYTVLCYPMKTIGFWTYRKVSLALMIIWIFSIGVCVPLFITHYCMEVHYTSAQINVTECFLNFTALNKNHYFEIADATTILSPCVVVIILYGAIIYTMVKQSRRLHASWKTQSNQERSRKRVALMLIVVVVVFLVCLLPTYIASHADPHFDSYEFLLLCYVFMLFNHIINPITYFGMSKDFRDAFRTLVMCKLRDARR